MFASPMRYEHHLCSTNHLKVMIFCLDIIKFIQLLLYIIYSVIIYCLFQKVDIYDRRTKRMAAVPSADEADGDVDMDNFMVLDSVGSGDG
jgi:hypothetical protein